MIEDITSMEWTNLSRHSFEVIHGLSRAIFCHLTNFSQNFFQRSICLFLYLFLFLFYIFFFFIFLFCLYFCSFFYPSIYLSLRFSNYTGPIPYPIIFISMSSRLKLLQQLFPVLGREPWSRGYRRRLMFQRS